MSNRKRIIVYRPGSIGDCLVCLPHFRAIRKGHQKDEIIMATNSPVTDQTISMAPIFKDLGVVDDYFYFSSKAGIKGRLRFLNKINSYNANKFIYLAEARNYLKVLIERMYFKFSGIPNQLGFPASRDQCTYRYHELTSSYESEASRLARCLEKADIRVDLNSFESWHYPLTNVSEKLKAAGPPVSKYVAVSMGGKKDVSDWGRERWQKLAEMLKSRYNKNLGLISFGSSLDREASQKILDMWQGPTANFCGNISLHDTAYLISKAALFVGHDSGLIHLAAAVGVRSVGIYSAMNLPGVWFPLGKEHSIIYNKTECYGCYLHECTVQRKKCIYGISPETVCAAIEKMIPNGKN